MLEKLVFNNLLSNNNMFEMFQSSFRAQHSAETALVKVGNNLRIHFDDKKLSVLLLLDLCMVLWWFFTGWFLRHRLSLVLDLIECFMGILHSKYNLV